MSTSYEDEAPSTENLSEERMGRVAKLAQEQLTLQAEILELEKKLEEKDIALNLVQGKTLPTLLNELGIQSFNLKDGTQVSLDKFYTATITDATRPAAHKWLEENNFGSLIKKVCVVALDVGDDLALSDLTTWLVDNKYDYAIEENVHWMTLKTFVRGQLETPAEEKPAIPPTDVFGIFVADKTTIKNPNEKTPKRKYEKKK